MTSIDCDEFTDLLIMLDTYHGEAQFAQRHPRSERWCDALATLGLAEKVLRNYALTARGRELLHRLQR